MKKRGTDACEAPGNGEGGTTLIGGSSARRGRHHNSKKKPSKKEADPLPGRSAFQHNSGN